MFPSIVMVPEMQNHFRKLFHSKKARTGQLLHTFNNVLDLEGLHIMMLHGFVLIYHPDQEGDSDLLHKCKIMLRLSETDNTIIATRSDCLYDS